MNQGKIDNIIIKYFSKSATITELEMLAKWLDNKENKQYFKEYVKLNYYIDYNLLDFELDQEKERILQRVKTKRVRLLESRFAEVYKYAAAILILVTAGYFFYIQEKSTIDTPIIVDNNIEIGTDKATLTLEDGTNVALEKGQNYNSGTLTSNGEEIIYKDGTSKEEIAYNYLTIPRGGQYQITLSDGTKVWLNSDSKLRYPVKFLEGVTREVELVYGEAYFDVSPSEFHNGDKFKVLHNKQEVEVLGTEFNIKAYLDEDYVYTTLVEGRVGVKNAHNNSILLPGQQSIVVSNAGALQINEVEVYNEISWKDGVFSFKDKSLKEIMKVMSRWYDVKIIFENKELEKVKFKGVLGRNQNIEEILAIMKSTKMNNYEINDKTIILR